MPRTTAFKTILLTTIAFIAGVSAHYVKSELGVRAQVGRPAPPSKTTGDFVPNQRGGDGACTACEWEYKVVAVEFGDPRYPASQAKGTIGPVENSFEYQLNQLGAQGFELVNSTVTFANAADEGSKVNYAIRGPVRYTALLKRPKRHQAQ